MADDDVSPVPPPPAPSPAPPPPEGAPPPAAKIVVNAERKEGDTDLAAELAAERKKLKDRETRLSELEDENRRLKTPPPSAPPAKKRGGWGFFQED